MERQMKQWTMSLFLVISVLVFGAAYTQTAVRPNSPATVPPVVPTELRLQLASQFSAFKQRHPFSGYLLVATRGKIVFEQGDGLIELSTRTAPNGQTRFQIGSLTKQFVAAAILVLVDHGKLDLTAKIGRYMPNLAKPVGDLTIHQLLSNTSGIAPAPFAEGATEQLLGPVNRAELLATFVEKPLRFKPGSKFEYSNSGFLLLGILIERVSGTSAASFFKEHLFQNAEMPHTFLPESGDFQQIRNQYTAGEFAVGYGRTSSGALEPHQEAFDMSVIFTAGAMVSTAHDLFNWNEALYSGKIFNSNLVEKMTTENLGQYCYGLYRSNLTNGALAYSHSGGIYGFHSYLLRVPNSQTTVVILSNDENQYIGHFGEQLAAIAAGQSAPLPAGNPPTTKHLAALTGTYAGQYLGNSIEFNLKSTQDQLFLIRPDGNQTPLSTESNHRFYAPASRATYSFIHGDETTITLNVEIDGIPVMTLRKKGQ
jgi:CubicO group peptidase (beta-lactamase class C family)